MIIERCRPCKSTWMLNLIPFIFCDRRSRYFLFLAEISFVSVKQWERSIFFKSQPLFKSSLKIFWSIPCSHRYRWNTMNYWLRAYPKSQQLMLKNHNIAIISGYQFRFHILSIVKVTAGDHFSDRLLDPYFLRTCTRLFCMRFLWRKIRFRGFP